MPPALVTTFLEAVVAYTRRESARPMNYCADLERLRGAHGCNTPRRFLAGSLIARADGCTRFSPRAVEPRRRNTPAIRRWNPYLAYKGDFVRELSGPVTLQCAEFRRKFRQEISPGAFHLVIFYPESSRVVSPAVVSWEFCVYILYICICVPIYTCMRVGKRYRML